MKKMRFFPHFKGGEVEREQFGWKVEEADKVMIVLGRV